MSTKAAAKTVYDVPAKNISAAVAFARRKMLAGKLTSDRLQVLYQIQTKPGKFSEALEKMRAEEEKKK